MEAGTERRRASNEGEGGMHADREAKEPNPPTRLKAAASAAHTWLEGDRGTRERADGAEEESGRGADGLRTGGYIREGGTETAKEAMGREEEQGGESTGNIAEESRQQQEVEHEANRPIVIENQSTTARCGGGRRRRRRGVEWSRTISAVVGCEAAGGGDEGAPFPNWRMTQRPLVQRRYCDIRANERTTNKTTINRADTR